MSRTEGSGSADDHSLALDLLGEIDLVAGRVLDEDVQVGNGVALLDEVPGGAVEGGGPDAGDVGCDTASEHHGSIGDYGIGIEDWRWAGAGGKARVEVALLMFREREELRRFGDFVISCWAWGRIASWTLQEPSCSSIEIELTIYNQKKLALILQHFQL